MRIIRANYITDLVYVSCHNPDEFVNGILFKSAQPGISLDPNERTRKDKDPVDTKIGSTLLSLQALTGG
jgi:hypothetical protein